MIQHRVRQLAAMFLLLQFLPGVLAQTGPSFTRPLLSSERFDVSAGLMYSFGEASWTERGGGDLFGGYRSQLDYEDLDATLFLVSGSAQINEKFRIDVHYGTGEADDGTGRDRDWLFGGFRGPDEEFVSDSRNDETSDITSADINLYYRFNAPEAPTTWEFFGGIDYYVDDLRGTNGRQVFFDGQTLNEPFAGLNSTYEFEWLSFKLGVAGETEIAPNLTLHGKAALIPFIDYNGEAFWNLRTDFKRTPPNFVHEANSGLGFEGKFSARYDWNNVYGELGYWYRQWDADDGRSDTFFADGTVAVAGLEAEATRHGAFGMIGFTF